MKKSTRETMPVCWIILVGCLSTWPALSIAQDSPPTKKSDQVFKSNQGGFQIKLNKPQYSVRKIQPKSGNHVDLFLFRVTSSETQSAASVSYHDLAKLPSAQSGLDGILENSVSGFSKSLDGRVSSDQKIKVANLPARQIEFESTSYGRKIRGISTWIVRKNRVYQLTYVAAIDKYDERAARSFMDSFRIIEIQQPKSSPVEPKKKVDPDKPDKPDKTKPGKTKPGKTKPGKTKPGKTKIKASDKAKIDPAAKKKSKR